MYKCIVGYIHICINPYICENVLMIISFATQKGGAGKTTTTIQTATAINHYYRKTVCVVDLDIQHSVVITRQEDMERVKDLSETGKLGGNNKEYQALKRLQEADKRLYPVYALDLKEPGVVERLQELDKEFDIVMVDIPGSIDVAGLSKVLMVMDYIFVPIFAERKNYNSAFDFLGTLEKLKRNSRVKLKDYFVYFFKYRTGERKDIWEFLENLFKEKGIYVFKHKIHEGNADDLNTSTIIPLRDNYGKSIYSFTEEFLGILYPAETFKK